MSKIITSMNQNKTYDILHDMYYLDDDVSIKDLSNKDQITYHTSMQDQKLSIYKQLLDEIRYRCSCIDDKIKYIRKNYITICLSDNEISMNQLYDLIKNISEQLNINLADLTNIQSNTEKFKTNYTIISDMLDETDPKTMMDTISKHGDINNQTIAFNKKIADMFDRINQSWNDLNHIVGLNSKMRNFIIAIYNYAQKNPNTEIPIHIFNHIDLSDKLKKKVLDKYYSLKGIKTKKPVNKVGEKNIKPLKTFSPSKIYLE